MVTDAVDVLDVDEALVWVSKSVRAARTPQALTACAAYRDVLLELRLALTGG
jgi:hypothetical protein